MNNDLLSSSKEHEDLKAYWRKKLEGISGEIDLHADYRNTAEEKETKEINFSLDEITTRKVIDFCKGQDISIYTLLLSVMELFLFKYTGQNDLVIASPVYRPDKMKFNSNKLIAIREVLNSEITFKELMLSVGETLKGSYKNQQYSVDNIAKMLGKKDWESSISKIIVLMDGIHEISSVEEIIKSSKNDMTLSISRSQNEIKVAFIYNSSLFNRNTILRISEMYRNILNQALLNLECNLVDFELITKDEKDYILNKYNNTDENYDYDFTLHDLFRRQVKKTPNNSAVIFGEETITYIQLDKKSNQVANYIRKCGFGKKDMIAVSAKRCINTIINVIGILKAGATYVPLEPEYPEDRKNYIIENSGCKMMLTPETYEYKEISAYSSEFDEVTSTPQDIAYIIFTSGSTGRPKGVVITHKAAANTIIDIGRKFNVTAGDRIIGLSSMCFDLSVYDIFGALSSGAALVQIKDQRDVNDVIRVVNKYGITIWNSVPAIMDMTVDNIDTALENTSLRLVMLSGDWIPLNLPQKILKNFSNAKIISLGGATEASIWSIYYPVDCVKEEWNSIPYGMPLANQKFYVLDKQIKLAPLNVQGELYIGGAGIALGYINDKERTNAAFIKHTEFGNLYKTGDYGKLHPEGYIEFLGRKDHQVKIRGYRVELGEIESVLTNALSIDEAVVIPHKGSKGSLNLCAYLVIDHEIDAFSIKDKLRQYLPEYMIPSYYVKLDKLPLTANGKVDRKALPEPLETTSRQEIVKPRNKLEEQLAEIWKNTLEIDEIGINNNFFSMGGDSIKAIQLVSRMQNKNMKISIQDLFNNPTISGISNYVTESAKKISQHMVEGGVVLSPIQKWFFDLKLKGKHNFNQYFKLLFKNEIDVSILKKTLNSLVEHHDALRMVFKFENSEIVQFNRGLGEGTFYLDTFDLRNDKQWQDTFDEKVLEINESMDLTHGPLVRAGLFKTINGDMLLLSIHHVVVDGFSWRIILEDFVTVYNQVANSQDICLEYKTNSYMDWTARLKDYANSTEFLKEMEYWKGIEANKTVSLPLEHEGIQPKVKDSEVIKLSLCKDETSLLLKDVNRVYKTEMNDILLTALEMTFKNYTGSEKVAVILEGHGREDIFEDLDISRTVGWFTSMFPVILEPSKNKDIAEHIKSVKVGLRGIPHKGIGYGILKYLTSKENSSTIDWGIKPQVCFNYLGQFDKLDSNGALEIASYSSGLTSHLESQMLFPLEISCLVDEQELVISLNYNKFMFKKETILYLLKDYKENLRSIIRHCMDRMDEIEIDDSEDDDQLYPQKSADKENMYLPFPLTEVQMAYLLGRDSQFEMGGVSTHMYLEIETKLDMKRFEESLQKVIMRHPMMRAVIMPNGYQRILENVTPYRLVVDDLSLLDSEAQQQRIIDERERMSHYIFEIDKGSLFEFKAFKLNSDTHYLFIGYDLLMADAASVMQIILRELLEFYNNPNLELPVLEFTFRDYMLAYKEFKDSETYARDKEYWMSKIEDFPLAPALPLKQDPAKIVKPHFRRYSKTIIKEQWDKIKKLAQQKNITPSVLLGTAYAEVLAYWSNQNRLAINLTVFNRYPFHQDVLNIVGDFTSIILLGIELKPNSTFWERAAHVQKNLVEALEHRHYDGVEFIREISKYNNLGSSVAMPIVFTSMVFNNINNDISRLGEIKASVSQTSQVFIDNQIMESNGELLIVWDYVEQLFEEEVIGTMFEQYAEVLTNLLDNGGISLLEPNEKDKKLLLEYNKTEEIIPKTMLHELFKEQVKLVPQNTAVIFEEDKLTYKELDDRSNQLARALINSRIEQGDFIGVLAVRCTNTIVNIMAVLKAGGAYIPIDPKYPMDRRLYLLENSGCKLLLEPEAYEKEKASIYSKDSLGEISKPSDKAYIIYTSGSTGKPKGVVITHEAAANTIIDINRKYNVNSDDRSIGLSSMCFDLSVYDIFGTLAAGATLVMIADQRDVNDIIKQIDKHHITIWNSVPAIMDMTIQGIENSMETRESEVDVNTNIYNETQNEEIYFWSPVLQWRKNTEEVVVGSYTYRGVAEKIFPEFYFITQNGVTINRLMENFSSVDAEELRAFISKAIEDRVLVSSVLTPSEVYSTQEKLFKHEYGNDLIFNSEAYSKFKEKQLHRSFKGVKLNTKVELKDWSYPELITSRRSYKVFDEQERISFDTLSQIISIFKQTKDSNYYYACSGGLYPIDVFIYVKEGRIEGLERGLYYHNPINNCLELVNGKDVITEDAHFYTNKSIFKSSAFTVFFIYNAEVTMPRYGAMGYFYASIDTGIMVGTMTQVAQMLDIGLCSIGDMAFEKVSDYFNLSKNQVLIHTVECGLKPDRVHNGKLPEISVKDASCMCEMNRVSNNDHSQIEHSLQGNTSLRLVMLSGDWIPLKLPDKIKDHFRSAQVVSLGGATEASIWSIYYPINQVEDDWKSIPYGIPLANQTFYVLNYEMRQCPVGVKGELYIGGVGVALGYHNDLEKTKGAFLEHPMFGRLYKTGDYGVMHRSGNIEFLGRKDNQVKIRGYRIELGEIESSLLKHKNINSAVVIDRTEPSGKKYICAYYVSDSKPDVSELKLHLLQELPEYMLPSYFIQLDRIPLTSNGKLDRRSLPEPSHNKVVAGNYVGPENEIERSLTSIWKDVLQINELGVNDDFFELGGYSMQATILLIRIQKEFNIELPLRQIFKTPTIREIAKYIQKGSREEKLIVHEQAKTSLSPDIKIFEDNLVLLRSSGESQKNLFLVHDVTGEVEGYIEFCDSLSCKYNFWGIRADRFEGYGPRNIDIGEIASKYIKKMKKIQPEGPYSIGGWSMGGTIAFEMVRQLEKEGERVELFAVFDSMEPCKELEKDAKFFTVESEKELLKEHLPQDLMTEVFQNTGDTVEVWKKMSSICEKNEVFATYFTAVIRENLGELVYAIPNSEQANISDLIYYMNVIRTIGNMHAFYIPDSPIESQMHFFKAVRSDMTKNKEEWNLYCKSPVKFYELDGTHFSIFKPREVKKLCNVFDAI